MYPVLALLLVALAVFTVLALRGRGRRWPWQADAPADPPSPASAARETLDGFALVGGAGLLVVAVAVVIIGLVSPDSGIADLVAMIAFFAYLVFVSVALVLARRVR